MARYSLFVLKVPLTPSKRTKHGEYWCMMIICKTHVSLYILFLQKMTESLQSRSIRTVILQVIHYLVKTNFCCANYFPAAALLSHLFNSQYSRTVLWHCWLGDRKGIRPGGGLLVVTVWHAHLTAPPPSPLAPVESRLETFWYRLILVHLENCH